MKPPVQQWLSNSPKSRHSQAFDGAQHHIVESGIAEKKGRGLSISSPSSRGMGQLVNREPVPVTTGRVESHSIRSPMYNARTEQRWLTDRYLLPLVATQCFFTCLILRGCGVIGLDGKGSDGIDSCC